MGMVIQSWNDATFSPIYVVYFGDMAAMVCAFIGAAYVIVKTVMAGVSTSNGFYFNYAAWSSFANRMFLYEVIIIGLW